MGTEAQGMWGVINGDSTQHRYQGTEERAKGILLSRGFQGLDLLADPPISELICPCERTPCSFHC